MNPILLSIGKFELRWYSVLILFAFAIGFILVLKKSKAKGISPAHVYDLSFYLVIFCILGARLYYCLFNLDYYSRHLIEILEVWNGGLAIHGGIIAGIIFLIIYAEKKELPFFGLTDIIAPSLALGQAIGRWGNFFNQEAYGSATTLQTLKNLHIPRFIREGMCINGIYYHPTFLYESLGCIIIFIILMFISSIKDLKRGIVTGIYFICYGTIRYFIEILRTDSLMLGNFKIAQIVSIVMVVVGILIIIKSLRSKYA